MSLPDDFSEELERIGEDINSIVSASIDDAGANEVFTDQIARNLVFFNKPLAVWEDELSVFIPPDKLDHETLRRLYVEVANKIQVASHFYTLSRAAETISSAGVVIKRADLITALMSYYHTNNLKLPPSAILDKMVDTYSKKLGNMNTLSKVIRDFWREKLATLDKVKSCLSSISIGVASELKYLNTD